MLAVFSAFPMFEQFQDALQKYFLQSLVPDRHLAAGAAGADASSPARPAALGRVGLLLLVLTALALMATIDRTLNAIWRVREMRSLWRRVLIYWSAATLVPLLLGVGLSFTSLAITASRGLLRGIPGGVGLLFDALGFILLAAAMTALYRFVPNTHVRWRHALAGGLFVAIGFELAKRVLAWYLVPGADLFAGLRRLRHRADPADLDLRQLGDRAVRRRDRRLCAEPADAHAAAARHARGALSPRGGGVARTDPCARRADARPERRTGVACLAHRPAAGRAAARPAGRHRLGRPARRGRRRALRAAVRPRHHAGAAAARATAARPGAGAAGLLAARRFRRADAGRPRAGARAVQRGSSLQCAARLRPGAWPGTSPRRRAGSAAGSDPRRPAPARSRCSR